MSPPSHSMHRVQSCLLLVVLAVTTTTIEANIQGSIRQLESDVARLVNLQVEEEKVFTAQDFCGGKFDFPECGQLAETLNKLQKHMVEDKYKLATYTTEPQRALHDYNTMEAEHNENWEEFQVEMENDVLTTIKKSIKSATICIQSDLNLPAGLSVVGVVAFPLWHGDKIPQISCDEWRIESTSVYGHYYKVTEAECGDNGQFYNLNKICQKDIDVKTPVPINDLRAVADSVLKVFAIQAKTGTLVIPPGEKSHKVDSGPDVTGGIATCKHKTYPKEDGLFTGGTSIWYRSNEIDGVLVLDVVLLATHDGSNSRYKAVQPNTGLMFSR